MHGYDLLEVDPDDVSINSDPTKREYDEALSSHCLNRVVEVVGGESSEEITSEHPVPVSSGGVARVPGPSI